jgi:hypothetical protein
MKKESKATRIRRLLLVGAVTDAAIAKVVKCHVSYVYMIKKAMDKVAPVKFKDQVVEKKKFSEFDASPKAIAWKGRNPWFGVDKDKTNYAIGLCMEAHTQDIDPKSSWYYTFIDQGMLKYVPPKDEIAEWKAKNDGTPFVGSKVKKMFKQEAVNYNKILDKEYAAKDALDHWENAVATPKSILDEAKDIIYGDREKTYGAPDKNLVAIAGYWSNHLLTRFGVFHEITGADVCVMMTLLKAARLGNNLTHRDSLVDAVGYLALLERIQK